MSRDRLPLVGRHVELRPLRAEDHADLCAVGLDERIWRFTTTKLRSPEDLRRWMDVGLRWEAQGTALPFALIDRASRRLIGSTRLAELDSPNRRADLGWTWIAPAWQRTAINTEAKRLLLGHAFETLGCLRVQLRANATNQISRRAILRLGAKEEGLLRSYKLDDDGNPCDFVIFSILSTEWPAVRSRLEARLATGSAATAHSAAGDAG